MSTSDHESRIARVLNDAEISIVRVEERSFPGERWFLVWVDEDSIAAAQSLAGTIEQELNFIHTTENESLAVTFRPHPTETEQPRSAAQKGALASSKVDQLIQLLEARSRTSDALPSLKYMEDPRASLAAIGASRHHLVYGRRGVGKTALLLEAKRLAEKDGHVTTWMNAHTLRLVDASVAFLVIAETVLASLIQHAGTSQADSFARLKDVSEKVSELRDSEGKVELVLRV